MKIQNLNNKLDVYATNFVKQAKPAEASEQNAATEAVASKKTDKLELSAQAKNLSAIYENIANGVYDSDEVMDEVASKILKDI